MTKKDIVLFLGAGFSSDAGLPTMADFGKESLRSHKELTKHTSQGQSPRFEGDLLVEAAEKFCQFQNLCGRSPAMRSADVNNMETLFCIAEAMYESGEDAVTLGDESYFIKKLMKDIQLWLWKIYQQVPPLNKLRKDEVKGKNYESFLKLLSPETVTVITTNYDLVFEYYASKHDKFCYYPVCGASEISINDASKGEIKRYAFTKDHPEICGFTICKLHGSINYFYKSGVDGEILISTEMGNGTIIGKSGSWPNHLPVILAVDAASEIKRKYGPEITPAIIPPTYAKFTQQQWLRNIWNAAYTALREAEKIVCIGYSMPESDGFMTALFNSALATRGNSRMPKIHLIDPSEKTFCRYCKFWGKLFDKTYGPLSFEEALNDYIPKILG